MSADSTTDATGLRTIQSRFLARAGVAGAIESALALLVVCAGGWAVWRSLQLAYLPQPFHYRPNETLADLYQLAWWAHHPGGYPLWREIYPPLSPVFVRLFSLKACYATAWPIGWVSGRACDWPLRAMLWAFFLINGPLVWLAYRRAGVSGAAARATAVALGLPMLYALDRGNLVIPCFAAFVLAESAILSSPIVRWLATGLALNFKPYLLVIALPRLAGRRWAWLLGCGSAGLAIYLLTLTLEGAGTPFELLSNVAFYGHNRTEGPQYWASFYYAASYWPLAHMAAAGFSFTRGFGPDGLAMLRLVIQIVMRAAQAGAAVCFLIACVRPQQINIARFSAMLMGLALTTITTGSAGYTEVFVLFLVFLEPWRGRVRPFVLVAAFLLCIPFDVALWPIDQSPARAFPSGRMVAPQFGIAIGQLLRPFLLLVIQFGLTILNLQDLLAPASALSGSPEAEDNARGLAPFRTAPVPLET